MLVGMPSIVRREDNGWILHRIEVAAERRGTLKARRALVFSVEGGFRIRLNVLHCAERIPEIVIHYTRGIAFGDGVHSR